MITVSVDGTARVWDMASGNCMYVLQVSGSPRRRGGVAAAEVASAVALAPNGAVFVTTASDFTARVWDLLTVRDKCRQGRSSPRDTRLLGTLTS